MGRFVEEYPVCPEKGGIVFKPAQITDMGDGFFFKKKLFCHEKAFAVDVAADGIAGFLFEKPHKMIFA